MPIRHIRRKLKSFFYKIKRASIKLLKLHSSPHEIALGVAAGVFIAIMPLYGLHTILVLLAFFIIRRINLIAIFIGTNISLPPTLPFITWAGYAIGRFILGKKYPAMNFDILGKFIVEIKKMFISIWGAFFHWENFKQIDFAELSKFYFPLFVGSAILGFACAILFYFLIYGFIARRHAAKLARKHRYRQHYYKEE